MGACEEEEKETVMAPYAKDVLIETAIGVAVVASFLIIVAIIFG